MAAHSRRADNLPLQASALNQLVRPWMVGNPYVRRVIEELPASWA